MRRKVLLIILSLSILLNIAAALYALKLRKYIHSEAQAASEYPISYKAARAHIYDSIPVDSADVVFFGDSITEGFPVGDLFGAKNRGIGWNTAQEMRYRLHQVRNAKKVYLLAGINDIGTGSTAAETFENFKAIADTLGSKLIVQSLLPVRGKYKQLTPVVEQYNKMMQVYCMQKGIKYLDLYTPMSKKDLTYDGLHLTYEGYMLWAQLIK